jgi:hypothetical protein
MFCILIYLHYRSIFLSDALSSIYGAVGVEHVRVGRIANLYITHSGTMYLT